MFQSIAVAARLGIADHLGDRPVPVDRLASLVNSDTDALYRFCRALDALGVLREHDGRRFSLAPMGALLRSDAPHTIRWSSSMLGGPIFRAFAESAEAVRTGRNAFEIAFGTSYHDYLTTDAESNRMFIAAMGGDPPPSIIDDIDLGEPRTIVDLGGGQGTLLAKLLTRYPLASGVLQELPSVADAAHKYLASEGLADRAGVFAHDFLDTVAPSGDVYVLSRTIQVLSDEQAGQLLRGLRAAMHPESRLVMMNRVLPDEPGFHVAKLTDLVMLIVYGGRERTETELSALLEANGLSVVRVRRDQSAAGKPDPRRAEIAFEAVPVD